MILDSSTLAYDTETTGLFPYLGDRPFAFVFSNGEGELYLDSRENDLDYIGTCLQKVFEDDTKTIFIHNAKFDMHHTREWMRDVLGRRIEFRARIIDTEVLARMVNNTRLSYSLDSIAKVYGYAKDDSVKAYITKHKLYEQYTTPWGDTDKKPCYDRVPRAIIQPYAELDARICYSIGIKLLEDLHNLNVAYPQRLVPQKDLFKVLETEIEFTKVLFDMEVEGVNCDLSYTKRAFITETEKTANADKDFEQLTGEPLTDSAKFLEKTFRAYPDDYARIERTAKGNPSFTDAVLSKFTSPVATAIRRRRESFKKLRTYYGNFIQMRSENGKIHTNFRQAGTATGRLSCSAPNFQNVNKEELTEDLMVRRCFVPPPNWYWVSIDYQAQEFRMLLDLAAEKRVIADVLNGTDVHQATANLVGVTRKEAKTINFGLLYGMGKQKLADSLGVSLVKAGDLRSQYFENLPMISQFTQAIMNKAKGGYITNWFGRTYLFEKEYAHKAVNYVIQGGCSDVMRLAMIAISKYIKENNLRSKMILSIHDELCFNMPSEELYHIKKFQELMTQAYPHRYLPLTTEASISLKSWADVEKYHGTETGNNLQATGSTGP